MKKAITFFIALLHSLLFSQNFNFQRSWATYFGNYGNCYNQIDTDGNLYLCTTINPDIHITPPITPNCYQPIYGGNGDIYLVKFNPSGSILWATYYGGSNGDQVYDMTIDNENNLIIIGYTTSTNGIADATSYIPTNNETLGTDLFLAKFNSSGTKIWGTYLGMGGAQATSISNSVTIVCDIANNIYFSNTTAKDNLGTLGVYQPTKLGTNTSIISKFNTNGTKAWSTYYGINGSYPLSIGANNTGIYVTGMTKDCPTAYTYNTYFATPNSLQTEPMSCSTTYLSKFDFNGQRVWSTYLGGTSNLSSYRNYVKGFENSIYVYGKSQYADVASADTFQNTYSDIAIMKFNDSGQKIWGTYLGANPNSSSPTLGGSSNRINFDQTGNIYFSGSTIFQDNIATTDGFQNVQNSNNSDSFAVKFTPNGQRLWGTYYGGTLGDSAEIKPTADGGFYLIGSTQSTDNIATASSFQPNYINYNSNNLPNQYIARFDPSLSTNNFEISKIKLFPNPNNGTFAVSGNQEINSIEIYDIVGKKVFEKEITNNQEIQTKNLSKGIYFAKIKTIEGTFKIEKIIIH